MEIIEVNQTDFKGIMQESYHLYGSPDFNRLNNEKCETVYYLLFKEGKYRLGIIGGIIDNSFYSPYSAPFGGFIFSNRNVKIKYIDDAVELLKEWAKIKKLETLNLILPPSIYDEKFINKLVNSLYRKKFSVSAIDLNYSFFLLNCNGEYVKSIQHNARKNLKQALKNDLIFHKCINSKEKRLAYEIIKRNKKANGYDLKMTWDQIVDTVKVIGSDFFVIYTKHGKPIASAIIFHVAQGVAQVIYWGDIREYSYLRTMNFLAYKVFQYYKSKNYSIVDLGPASEKSIPNQGLSDFKESIGCSITTKMNLIYNLA